MNYRVLMIDDDETIAANTAEYFNIFDIRTAYVTGFEAALAFLEENTVSLLLLDINLGDRSGFELCRQIRSRYDMPIFFISARTADDDVLMALGIGGDDYIKKPYTMSILLAKVKAALNRYENTSRRQNLSPADSIIISGDMYLDTRSHSVCRGKESIPLKAMEFRMLKYLLENRGKIISKDEFLKNVWEDEYVGEGTLSVHIRHLREKIETDPNDPQLIKTVWGTGYIMEG
ncbi:MAG: response regulator transcription factor [Oscillospiraceae bacterium]|nr:response regulator transcription factor [Oscillospiraceae bacterium]